MFSRWFNRVLIAFTFAAGLVLVFMWVTVNFEIIMRYFLGQSTMWVVDFAEYAIIYITFLATAWVLAREGHVKIELLVDRLPPRAQWMLNTVTSVIGALLCAVLFWYSLQITLEAIEQRALFTEGGMIVPVWPILIVMPVGSLVLTLQFLRRARHYARESKVSEKGGG